MGYQWCLGNNIMTKKNSQKICLLSQELLIAILLSILILGGCQYAHDPGYSTKQPRITDLVGVWQPTPDSIADMTTRGRYKISTHQLILCSDGTFSMINMPDCVFSGWSSGWDESKGKFKSGHGNWRISLLEYDGRKVWDVDFTFTTKGIGELPSIAEPTLIGQGNPYLLHFGFGDLDFSDAVNFQK